MVFHHNRLSLKTLFPNCICATDILNCKRIWTNISGKHMAPWHLFGQFISTIQTTWLNEFSNLFLTFVTFEHIFVVQILFLLVDFLTNSCSKVSSWWSMVFLRKSNDNLCKSSHYEENRHIFYDIFSFVYSYRLETLTIWQNNLT